MPRTVLIAAVLAALSSPVSAKVVQSSAAGFAVSHTADVAATPAVIWAQLLHPENWWNGAHSWSGSAANLSLTAVPGGCFCEKLPGGGFAEHARVTHAMPDKLLRLSGALGPLQGEALVGTLTITIKSAAQGTSTVSFDYVVGGNARFALTDLAPAVDGVIGEQQRRLAQLFAKPVN